jgi:hypothetical protein
MMGRSRGGEQDNNRDEEEEDRNHSDDNRDEDDNANDGLPSTRPHRCEQLLAGWIGC